MQFSAGIDTYLGSTNPLNGFATLSSDDAPAVNGKGCCIDDGVDREEGIPLGGGRPTGWGSLSKNRWTLRVLLELGVTLPPVAAFSEAMLVCQSPEKEDKSSH